MNVIRTSGCARSDRELLLDLGDVTVARDAVRVEVLVDGHEMGLVGRGAPGARHPGLRVDDHVLDDPGPRQRCERQQRRGRVAARVRDQRGAADVLAVQLGEPVDSLAEELGRLVLAVPAPVHRGVVQAEVGAQVDDADATLAQLGDDGRGGAVGVGDDRGVDLGVAIEIELVELERHPVMGIQVVEPPPHVAAGGHRAQLQGWMAVQQPRGQRAREACGSEHRHAMRHGSSRPARRPPPRRSPRAARRPPRR